MVVSEDHIALQSLGPNIKPINETGKAGGKLLIRQSD
jgi:hypothetical protein